MASRLRNTEPTGEKRKFGKKRNEFSTSSFPGGWQGNSPDPTTDTHPSHTSHTSHKSDRNAHPGLTTREVALIKDRIDDRVADQGLFFFGSSSISSSSRMPKLERTKEPNKATPPVRSRRTFLSNSRSVTAHTHTPAEKWCHRSQNRSACNGGSGYPMTG